MRSEGTRAARPVPAGAAPRPSVPRPVLLALGALALAATARVPASAQDEMGAARSDQPREVAAFLRRRAGCARLTSDGENPDLVATNVRSRQQLKCTTLESDERRLRARFATSPAVLDALDQADADYD